MDYSTSDRVARAQYWWARVKSDLDTRSSRLHRRWSKYEKMVRNTGEGFLEGNLISAWSSMLLDRLFSDENTGVPDVDSDDPDQQKRASEVQTIAAALLRSIGFTRELDLATRDSIWATTGYLEIGHPMAQYPADLMQSYTAPRVIPERPTSGPFEDRYQPVPQPLDVDPSQIPIMDPFEEATVYEEYDPGPLVTSDTGYPWVSRVHPAYIVTSVDIESLEQADYVARLRPYTCGEFKHYFNRDPSSMMRATSQELYQMGESVDPNLVGGVGFMVELWVRRDRRNPKYGDWFYSFPLGMPEDLLFEGPNPLGGGFWPIQAVKPMRLKRLNDLPVAGELDRLSRTFDKAMRAVTQDVTQVLNRKTLVSPGAGLDPKEAEKLRNPDYQGSVEVQDPSSIQEYRQERLDPQFLTIISWLRGQATSTTGSSEIDTGTPIKGISARQTSALLESSGIRVGSLKLGIAEGAGSALGKVMYLAQKFGAQTPRSSFNFAGHTVVMDPRTHDYTRSYKFAFSFSDREQGAEESLLLTQFLRLVISDTGGVALQHLDIQALLEELVVAMGLPKRVLARYGANHAPAGLRTSADLSAESGILSSGLTGSPDPTTLGQVLGSHPERLLGSRGVGGQQMVENALSGLARMQ